MKTLLSCLFTVLIKDIKKHLYLWSFLEILAEKGGKKMKCIDTQNLCCFNKCSYQVNKFLVMYWKYLSSKKEKKFSDKWWCFITKTNQTSFPWWFIVMFFFLLNETKDENLNCVAKVDIKKKVNEGKEMCWKNYINIF